VGKHPERVSVPPMSGSPGERLDQPTYVTRKRHHRGTPYFAPAIELPTHELLGRGVGDGTHGHVRGGNATGVIEGSGNAKVGKENPLVIGAEIGHDDVGGLDVSVPPDRRNPPPQCRGPRRPSPDTHAPAHSPPRSCRRYRQPSRECLSSVLSSVVTLRRAGEDSGVLEHDQLTPSGLMVHDHHPGARIREEQRPKWGQIR
jgi:hypothetical protein